MRGRLSFKTLTQAPAAAQALAPRPHATPMRWRRAPVRLNGRGDELRERARAHKGTHPRRYNEGRCCGRVRPRRARPSRPKERRSRATSPSEQGQRRPRGARTTLKTKHRRRSRCAARATPYKHKAGVQGQPPTDPLKWYRLPAIGSPNTLPCVQPQHRHLRPPAH